MTYVREERSPGVSILHISGPLRVPLSRDLELAVHAVLRGGARRIDLNLAAVSDLDAGGVGELVQVYNLAAGEAFDPRDFLGSLGSAHVKVDFLC